MKRNFEIKVRLNTDEYVDLMSKVLTSGYSRERYIRSLISGVVPKEKPPIEYYQLIREFNAIGNNLNQLVRNSYHEDQKEMVMEVLEKLKTMITNLDNQVRNPKA